MTPSRRFLRLDAIPCTVAFASGACLLVALAGCGGGVSSSSGPEASHAPDLPSQDLAAASADDPPGRLPASVVDASKPQSLPEADALFETLASPESTPTEWEQAQQRLVELGAAVVPTLERELASSEPHRREVAASGLAMLGPDSAEAAAALQRALGDDSIHVRANAATALCAIPEQEAIVIPALAELLVNDDPQVRQMSAVNLSNFGEDAAPYVEDLTAALERIPDDVLVPVLELLGRIGPAAEAAAPRLQQIAFEQSGEARQAARAALERISEKPAAE